MADLPSAAPSSSSIKSVDLADDIGALFKHAAGGKPASLRFPFCSAENLDSPGTVSWVGEVLCWCADMVIALDRC